jgi:NADP-dependent 3-hydroxy acid dehydrogenase YdfG
MKLRNQTAMITGASQGLGLAIARRLAAEGADVSLVARAGEKLDQAAAEVAKLGVKAIGVGADVTRSAEVERAVKRTLDDFGRIDVLVLNAGTWQGAPIAETSEETWDTLLDLNLKGAFLALKHSIPAMVAQKGGTVIGIASLGALVGQPGSAAYAASKWGLRGLLESAALELKPHHVRVSLVYPHNINSAGREIAPGSEERDKNLETSEIADMIAWIASAPAHVSVGNVTIWPIQAGLKAQL